MKKQQAEEGKANWLNSQIVAIGRQPEGAARDLMIKGFARQAPQVFPGFNQDIPEMMKKDPQFAQDAVVAAKHFSEGGQFDPKGLNAWTTMSTPEAIDMAKHAREGIDKIRAAQLGGQAMRAANMQDNTVFNQVKGLRDNPSVKTGIAKGQAFDTDMDQLNNKPNWQTYQEAFMNYANSLTGMKGVISDAKLHEMQSALRGPTQGKWSTFATDNPGAAGNEASPEAVAWLKGKIGEVSRVNDVQIGSAARRHANVNGKYINNQKAIGALNDEAKQYQGGGWRMIEGSGRSADQLYSPPGASNAAPPVSYGATPKEIEQNYQAYLAQKAHQQAGK